MNPVNPEDSKAVGSAVVGALPAQPVGAPDAGRLGNNADFVSGGGVLPSLSTVKAWLYRSHGRELLKKSGINKRLRWCGSRITRGLDGVGVYARPDRAYGRVHGVCVCGQSLCCPVCAPRIAAFRAQEVSQCFSRCREMGLEARLVTYTIPHTLGSTLGREIDCFAAAWRVYQTGRRGVECRRGCYGYHVGREVTWGAQHGWHYHHHVLRYDQPGSFRDELVRAQWLVALDSVGRRWRGADLHAYDSGVVGSEAGARYVAKLATSVDAQARAIGSEIASAATKGRNLATLLAQSLGGDVSAGSVWISGVSDITARKVSSVRWSRGLRAAVGLASEKSDEQIGAEEVTSSDEFLGALSPWQWQGVLRWRAEFALVVAANQGREAVDMLLSGLDLGRLDDDDPRLSHRREINQSAINEKDISKC